VCVWMEGVCVDGGVCVCLRVDVDVVAGMRVRVCISTGMTSLVKADWTKVKSALLAFRRYTS
jgi:hypothetical protein